MYKVRFTKYDLIFNSSTRLKTDRLPLLQERVEMRQNSESLSAKINVAREVQGMSNYRQATSSLRTNKIRYGKAKFLLF
jgi:hypothetical protein